MEMSYLDIRPLQLKSLRDFGFCAIKTNGRHFDPFKIAQIIFCCGEDTFRVRVLSVQDEPDGGQIYVFGALPSY